MAGSTEHVSASAGTVLFVFYLMTLSVSTLSPKRTGLLEVIFRHLPGGTTKAMKPLSQDSMCSRRDSNIVSTDMQNHWTIG